jgi:hypothetical protein
MRGIDGGSACRKIPEKELGAFLLKKYHPWYF